VRERRLRVEVATTYSVLTAWPPNSFLSAASTFAPYESSWRDRKRVSSESVITEGALRASHRELDPARSSAGAPYHLEEHPQPLVAGKTYDFDIAIIPTADRSKATVKVRIAIKVKDARIVPDMGVRVAFLGAATAPTRAPVAAGVLVPADAVRGDGTVFVYADGRVARRTVTPGQTVGTEREILKGLRAGERVVVAPPASLKDGAAVRVADK